MANVHTTDPPLMGTVLEVSWSKRSGGEEPSVLTTTTNPLAEGLGGLTVQPQLPPSLFAAQRAVFTHNFTSRAIQLSPCDAEVTALLLKWTGHLRAIFFLSRVTAELQALREEGSFFLSFDF